MGSARPLATCAVIFVVGGCISSDRFAAEPPIPTERIDRTASKTIGPLPMKARAVAHSVVKEPATIVLPPWKVAAAAKPGIASNPAMPPTRLFEKVSPSVYGVKVAQEANREVAVSYGSAVAITSKEAITNCHVVSQGKVIILSNGATTLPAEVSSADTRSDRCYLKVLTGVLEPVLGVRDFGNLAVGEPVYTIGSPRGLDKTLGQGLLSGLRKMENVEYVQITAPVSEGSSGGGLFDDRGNLIGITTFTIRGSQNLNFAIAASEYWR